MCCGYVCLSVVGMQPTSFIRKFSIISIFEVTERVFRWNLNVKVYRAQQCIVASSVILFPANHILFQHDGRRLSTVACTPNLMKHTNIFLTWCLLIGWVVLSHLIMMCFVEFRDRGLRWRRDKSSLCEGACSWTVSWLALRFTGILWHRSLVQKTEGTVECASSFNCHASDSEQRR